MFIKLRQPHPLIFHVIGTKVIVGEVELRGGLTLNTNFAAVELEWGTEFAQLRGDDGS
jgi:hypothetical protein